jgi:hypothetical protein
MHLAERKKVRYSYQTTVEYFHLNILDSFMTIVKGLGMSLTPKILRDQIWVAGYFGQPLTYTYFVFLIMTFCVTS